MKKMLKIAEGAYFVPSYPEVTVITFQKATNNQTIIIGNQEPKVKKIPLKKEEEIEMAGVSSVEE